MGELLFGQCKLAELKYCYQEDWPRDKKSKGKQTKDKCSKTEPNISDSVDLYTVFLCIFWPKILSTTWPTI